MAQKPSRACRAPALIANVSSEPRDRMGAIRHALRSGFAGLEAVLDRIFSQAWNPLYHLGALGFYFYWIAIVTGIYLYIVFDTSVSGAYESVESLTQQWYLGGLMRSLHRYSSDGLVLMLIVHMLREFALDRFRGPRWFTWVTGVPIIALVYGSGITGYLLVWDELAQYVAISTAEFFDWLPIFADPIARNFLRPGSVEDRFFTLLVFLHIFVPLFLLLVLWLHLLRVSRARINPPRALGIGTFAMLAALALVHPVTSHAPANLASVVGRVELDWYYLLLYPLFDRWSAGTMWLLLSLVALLLIALPWLPPRRRRAKAAVDLAHCNGCTWCEQDCPHAAISMQPRSDGRAYSQEAVVNPSLCVSCGVCAGSCPSATPFRVRAALTTGIDLPDEPITEIKRKIEQRSRALTGVTRVLLFGCRHAASLRRLESPDVAIVDLECCAQLPPSFIDFVLSRGLADGVVVTGCPQENCQYRLGNTWTAARISRQRDPRLRARVPRERLLVAWAGLAETNALRREVQAFAGRLAALPSTREAETPASTIRTAGATP
jgi:quinol-cytochrome oxidoreductase complex cytochrome b subunit/coenzyme F420-reducing hydrogenase delta subunit